MAERAPTVGGNRGGGEGAGMMKRAQAKHHAVAAAFCLAWGAWGLGTGIGSWWYPALAGGLGLLNAAIAWRYWRGR